MPAPAGGGAGARGGARAGGAGARGGGGRRAASPALPDRALLADVTRRGADKDVVAARRDRPVARRRIPVRERAGVERESHALRLARRERHPLESLELLR